MGTRGSYEPLILGKHEGKTDTSVPEEKYLNSACLGSYFPASALIRNGWARGLTLREVYAPG